MSGDPVFNKDYKVIGIAATGAEAPNLAHLTEKHGIIPITAIQYLNY